MNKRIISPSLLSANFTRLTEDIKKVEPIAKTGLKQGRLREKTQIPPFFDPKGKGKTINIRT